MDRQHGLLRLFGLGQMRDWANVWAEIDLITAIFVFNCAIAIVAF